MVIVVLVGSATGCTTPRSDPPSVFPTSSESAPTTVLADRAGATLTDVDLGALRLGGDFNRAFLTTQFRVLGLAPGEAECAVGRAVAALDGFGSLAVRELTVSPTGSGFDPAILLACLPLERISVLAEQVGEHPITPDAAAELRDLLGRLAVAGYVSSGFEDVEARCLADRVVGRRTDAEMLDLLAAAGTAPQDRPDDESVRACLSPERLQQVGG